MLELYSEVEDVIYSFETKELLDRFEASGEETYASIRKIQEGEKDAFNISPV